MEWFHREIPLINNANPLLVLSILMLTGLLFTKIAKKIRFPAITGQIIGGIVIGHYVLNLFPDEAFANFTPITNFVLGLIGLTIGSHLDFKKLHNSGKRIFGIAFMDILFVIPLVFSGLFYIAKMPFEVCLLVSVIAAATAPGSVIHIVKETRAKGLFTKTLLAVVALNNVIVILLFYSVFYYLVNSSNLGDVSIFITLLQPLKYLSESFIDGGGVGLALILFTEKKRHNNYSFPALVLLSVFLVVGISETLSFSGLLSSLILGVIITNFSNYKEKLFTAFKDIETEIFTIFFVLAGTHLDFMAMKIAGLSGLVLIVTRFLGKYVGTTIGAKLSTTASSVKKYMGISLFPFAGVAIGLVLFAANSPAIKEYASSITAIILTAVVFYELVGPIFTGYAIKQVGDKQKNRVRLMDFLQEEFIKVNISAIDKWSAIDEMAEFMFKTHNIRGMTIEELKDSILERENEISTGIGENIAIPHAIVETGPKILGVIGISKKGIDFDSLDEEPVNIIILIATPKTRYDLHLNVLASIAKIFSHSPSVKRHILRANTSEEVFEVLQAEEIERLNPFFEN